MITLIRMEENMGPKIQILFLNCYFLLLNFSC